VSPTRRLMTRLAITWALLVAAGSVVIAVLPFPPDNASDTAQSITTTLRLLTWLAWPIFIAVLLAIAGAVLVSRRAPAPRVSAEKLRGNPRMTGVWVGVVGVAVLLLAVFGTLTLTSEEAAETLGVGGRGVSGGTTGGQVENTTIEVQVIAQQWAFTYRYPGYDGFESAHLVLPVNANVTFHITSLDVVHSFWYPALGVKADAVPLHDNTFATHVQQIGTFRLQCGELCGLWHGGMDDSNAQVVSVSDFGTWVAQQKALNEPIKQYLPPYSYTYVPDPPAYGT
jgi:cytochrome c oxidase subunit 2